MTKGCDRPIYRNGVWHYCGENGKRCMDCGGDMRALSDDEIAAAIVRSEGAGAVGRVDRIVDAVMAVLFVLALAWWML